MISAFDILKIGIRPSSSHTVGPMNAGKSFIDLLVSSGELPGAMHIVVDLCGPLSLTGKGHATNVTIMMGLANNSPQNVNIDSIAGSTQEVAHTGRLPVAEDTHIIDFSPGKNILFHAETLSRHESGMRVTAWNDTKTLLSKTYYPVDGGFIVEGEQFGQVRDAEAHVPYNFHSASELLKLCERDGLSVSGLMMQSKLVMRSKEEIDAGFAAIWDVMHARIKHGMSIEGVLLGPSNVPHRTVALCRLLVSSDNLSSDPMNVVDRIDMFALAVSEENTTGCRVVTTLTDGACGITPAVLAYYDKFRRPVNADSIARYLLTARTMETLYKINTSVSGAEVDCQGEIGVVCSMAAAGLVELLGGSPSQVCIAAETAMEHNLRLTCDPVAGQVQTPCIERNAISAIKAVNAARVMLRCTSEPRVSFDRMIETVYKTGKDMNDKYRETLRGGLVIEAICA